ncbi:hypothetical protein ALC53_10900 [Atta colombica]|uniref:Uncharacterized protein n=1 Tax=Atta colombica TaxID=520822 RepID=A0A151I068_9HYME|nr:hypothetical protein ALC53_10900 [Atta colombica]
MPSGTKRSSSERMEKLNLPANAFCNVMNANNTERGSREHFRLGLTEEVASLEISGFEKLQVHRTDLTSSSETPTSAYSFSYTSRSNFLDENCITELRGDGTQPRTGAAARIAHTRDCDTCAPDGSGCSSCSDDVKGEAGTSADNTAALFRRTKFTLRDSVNSDHRRAELQLILLRAQVKPGRCTGERALHCRARTLFRSFHCIRVRIVSDCRFYTREKRDKRFVLVIFGVSTIGVREVHKSFLEYRNVSALNSPVVVYIRFYVKILSLKKTRSTLYADRNNLDSLLFMSLPVINDCPRFRMCSYKCRTFIG